MLVPIESKKMLRREAAFEIVQENAFALVASVHAHVHPGIGNTTRVAAA